MGKKDAILFLTNNDNTEVLYQWLLKEEGSSRTIKYSDKITVETIYRFDVAFIVSFNYKYIIPKDVIEYMKNRIINLHISYLPYNRGSSPNFFSFLDDSPKGVTIHLVDENLDTGSILCQKEVFFDEKQETFITSHDKLITEISNLFKANWSDIKNGKINPVPQLGEGSFHRIKDVDSFREQHPFSWNEVIYDFKQRCGL